MYLAQDNEYSTISSLFEYHDILESKNLSHSSKTAYVDAYNLTNENITVGIDSSPWLNYNRQKTDIRVALPLLEPAQRILAMYDCYNTHKRNSRLFPITKNQVVNRYLKQITIEAGVEKVVTFHMARHTVWILLTISQWTTIDKNSIGKIDSFLHSLIWDTELSLQKQ